MEDEDDEQVEEEDHEQVGLVGTEDPQDAARIPRSDHRRRIHWLDLMD